MYSQISLFLDTILDNAEPICTQGVTLSNADRFIFWIGGSLVFLVTLFLILGALISKRLRQQPGDLIVGIAFSDFLLSIHWLILATWYYKVDDPTFCTIVGGIGTFAGINEFLYNLSFSVFLIVSLRNALKQSNIPKKLFHAINIGAAAGYVGYLLARGEIGKTIVGTCSIATQCRSNFLSYLGTVVVACYTGVGIYTYMYVKRNAPQCKRAHTKRIAFLAYYMRYVIACIVVYGLIVITTLATTIVSNNILDDGDDTIDQQERARYSWINSLYNVVKLCSPLVLSFVRLNDPKIKAVIKQGIFFWRKDISVKPENVPLIENKDQENANLMKSQSLDDSGILMFNMSKDRKIEITYTLLSCVAFARFYQENSRDLTDLQVYDRKPSDRFKREQVFMVDMPIITSVLPRIQNEIDRARYTLLSGTLKVYAPEVFAEFINKDSQFLNIIESLDFLENKEEIKEASGSDGGKSGEFFFFSRDKKLIIKTIPDMELNMLISILERYDAHFKKYPSSLIAKIYGAFTYENTDMGLRFNLIVMKNICGFPSKFVERKYDMKGSKYDRETLKGQEDVSEETLMKKVLKDADFEKYEKKLFLMPETSQYFLTQVEIDSIFLRDVKLIDYSFMVYIVNKQQAAEEVPPEKDFTRMNSLASAEHSKRPGVYYNMGIIDYLQPYNFQKKFERFLKRVKKLNPNLDTSSQDPEYYSQRFIQFMNQIGK